MKRDTVINVLLIIAGILLAFALFGAGAFWKGKSSSKRSSQLTSTLIANPRCCTAGETNPT
jgi:hypothetical protein